MTTRGSRIRIRCVDDHTIVRQGVSALLCDEPNTEVDSSAANGRDAIDEYRRWPPDAALMNLQLPEMSSFDATRQIRRDDPNARIIVPTMHHWRGTRPSCQRSRRGRLPAKEHARRPVDRCISEAQARSATSPRSEAATCRRASTKWPSRQERCRCWSCWQRGRATRIGSSLGITEGAVQTHIKSIFAKLQVHDRTALLAAAVERGIIYLGP
jgi:two-component system NarL family response regulator